MEKPLPDWFVTEVKDRLWQGQTYAGIATAMTKKYAIVIRPAEILKAVNQ